MLGFSRHLTRKITGTAAEHRACWNLLRTAPNDQSERTPMTAIIHRGKIVSARTAPDGQSVHLIEFGQVVKAVDHATAIAGRAAYLSEMERCRKEGA
jgi:hypothetical protein